MYAEQQENADDVGCTGPGSQRVTAGVPLLARLPLDQGVSADGSNAACEPLLARLPLDQGASADGSNAGGATNTSLDANNQCLVKVEIKLKVGSCTRLDPHSNKAPLARRTQSYYAYVSMSLIALLGGGLAATNHMKISRALIAGMSQSSAAYCYFVTKAAYGECAPRWVWVLLFVAVPAGFACAAVREVDIYGFTPNTTVTHPESHSPARAAAEWGNFMIFMTTWIACGFRRGAPAATTQKWGSLWLFVLLQGLLTPVGFLVDLDKLICPDFFTYALVGSMLGPFLCGFFDSCLYVSRMVEWDGFYMSVLLYMVYSAPFAIMNCWASTPQYPTAPLCKQPRCMSARWRCSMEV